MSAMPHVVVGVFLAEDEQFEIAIGVGRPRRMRRSISRRRRGIEETQQRWAGRVGSAVLPIKPLAVPSR